MDLEHPDLTPFEPTLRRLIERAFSPPLLYPGSALLVLRWAPDNQPRRFVAECLAAYRILQRDVAGEAIALEHHATRLTSQLKDARRARDKLQTARFDAAVRIARRRQLILRRMLDAVVYLVCDQYVWFVRRLALRDDVAPIDLSTLARAVEEATRRGEREPDTLHLAADLTTSVQIGDLLEAFVDSELRWHVRVVEIKDGRINRILEERLGDHDMVSHETLLTIRSELGAKAADQAARMLRQRRRLRGLSDLRRTRRGLDPRTGREIQRTRDTPPAPSYQPELRALIEATARHGQHLIQIDKCLTLAGVRDDVSGEPSLVAHSLFHYKRPNTLCLLSGERAEEELTVLAHEPPVIDLVEHTYRSTWSSPVFSWGSLDRVCDLLTGRIRVYGQFDVTVFMERAARMGMKMSWVTGRRAEMLKQTGITTRIPGSPRASAILVELPDHTRIELLLGALGRIFLELARPDTILKSLLASGPEAQRVQDELARGRDR